MDWGMFFLGLLIYTIPTIVALVRRHPNKLLVAAVNLGLGWTLVGWIAAFVWALIKVDLVAKARSGARVAGREVSRRGVEASRRTVEVRQKQEAKRAGAKQQRQQRLEQRKQEAAAAKARREADREQRRQEAAAARARRNAEWERKRQERDAARREAEFWASPVGQARAAYERGDTIFQVSIPVRETGRTVAASLFHSMEAGDVRARDVGGHGQILTAIQAEGWKLIQSSTAFEQTHAASRDKFLSSGQKTAISGRTVVTYVFERVEKN